MYMSNEYREGDRQIKKYAEKMSWYDNVRDDTWVKVEWRNKLRGMWKGKRPLQRGVKDMRFTTVIQVPNTNTAEHIRGLMNGDEAIFILKHWPIDHEDDMEPPKIR